MPASILSRLGIAPLFKMEFTLANGMKIERDVSQIVMRLDGKSLYTICIFGDEETVPLLGAVTLEEFGLGVDPINKRLIPVPRFLL